MAIEIRVPTMGESVNGAEVGKWHKQSGDRVKMDEPVVDLETDKTTLEICAPAAGVLQDDLVPAGEVVLPEALLGSIDAAATAPLPPPPEEPKVSEPAAKKTAPRIARQPEIAGSTETYGAGLLGEAARAADIALANKKARN